MRDEENIWTKREKRRERWSDGGVSCLGVMCWVRVQIGGEGGEGWVDVEVIGVAQGAQDRGAHLLVMGRAVSWRDEEEGGGGSKTKEGGEGQRRERKQEVKTRSVYTKKCSASDSRTG